MTLIEALIAPLRRMHYSPRTEEAYVHWTREFLRFHRRRHPRGMGAPEVTGFLNELGIPRNTAASSPNQALGVAMVDVARAVAEAAARPAIASATARMDQVLGAEIDRLRALAAVNPNVRAEEVRATEAQRTELTSQLARARLRVDAVRVILLGEIS